ncbi:MAG: hypothetical protein AAGF47_02240 [Planctomycetota bacterium]
MGTLEQQVWTFLGLLIGAVGIGLLAISRRGGLEGVQVWWVGWVGPSSITAAGLALVFGAYHLIAYLGVPGWIALAVRRDLWWLVPIGCVVTIVGSIASERSLGGARTGGGDAESEPDDASF